MSAEAPFPNRLVVRHVAGMDVRTYVGVRNRVTPEWPTDEQEVRELEHRQARRTTLLAEVGGEPVGTGAFALLSGRPDSDYADGDARVLPGRRRFGVGSALLAEVSRLARALGKRGLEIHACEDDPDGAGFLVRRGYREVERMLRVALDVQSRPAPPVEPPPGIRIVPLSERPGLAEGMYAVGVEAIPDMPAAETEQAGTFDEWATWEMRHPMFWDAMVALEGDRVVGYGSLYRPRMRPGDVDHGTTGILRSHRRRGIASAVKRAQVAHCRAHGVRRMLTDNALENEPIRRINLRLGYEPLPAFVTLRGPLLDR